MSMPPQPPRPPVDPRPPSQRSHLLLIALLVLALIVVVSAATIWFGAQYLARGVKVNVDESGAGAKQVSIKTPLGSLEVATDADVDEARLALPLYPGAARASADGSASVNLSFGEEADLRVLALKLETTDAIEKVRDFYFNRLGDDVTNFVDKNPEGKTVFEIKRKGQERIVALRSKGTGTEIELARVTHGPREAN